MRVQIIQAWPRRFETRDLDLPAGATVADAITASGFATSEEGGQAVFGERVACDHLLRDGDRLELLRPLQIDPKESRRRRAQRTQRQRPPRESS